MIFWIWILWNKGRAGLWASCDMSLHCRCYWSFIVCPMAPAYWLLLSCWTPVTVWHCCHYELMQFLVACSRLSLLSLMPSCISVCV